MLQKSTLRTFGIEDLGIYSGPAHKRALEDIADAIQNRQMLAIIGDFGAGKTELVDMAVRAATKDGTRIVWISTPDKERLRIPTILWQMVTDITEGNEPPKRGSGALSHQLRRILGETVIAGGQEVCVIIENAHRMHPNTLMAIKDLSELRYNGVRPLFSLLYIGHKKLGARLSAYGEVDHRTQRLFLDEAHGWMTPAERIDYLTARFGPAIKPSTRRRIAALHTRPLLMDRAVERYLTEAHAAGYTVLDERIVQPSLAEIKTALGEQHASHQRIADAAARAGAGAISRGTVSDVVNGKNTSTENVSKVRAGLRLLEDELTAIA